MVFRKSSILREVIKTAVLVIALFFILHWAFLSYRVVGYSMEPNLHNGQYLLASKLVYFKAGWLDSFRKGGYLFHPPRRGEVVIFKRNGSFLVKRIIGLGGEVVEIKRGRVYINGKPLIEPYIKEPPAYNLPPTKIPKGYYFVLGDNRNNSTDSHVFGPIPEGNIVGRVLILYWPPSSWGLAPNFSYGN